MHIYTYVCIYIYIYKVIYIIYNIITYALLVRHVVHEAEEHLGPLVLV